jgi:uncharacterized protein
MLCFHVSDLHGSPHRYRALFERIRAEQPAAVFIGGDILPATSAAWKRIDPSFSDFTTDVLVKTLSAIRDELGSAYPRVFIIPGNDDPRGEIEENITANEHGLWEYLHMKCAQWGVFTVCGYGCVPPTPFRLKDWERYDVSRYVDPGSYPPEEGAHTSPLSLEDICSGTIQDNLRTLAEHVEMDRCILLFHSPPYRSKLDRAGLDGKMIDHVPLDVHVGSIAIRRFIEQRKPRITLHGHVHESARITGAWRDRIGETHLFTAAHDGKELALVRFDPHTPADATRTLISPSE